MRFPQAPHKHASATGLLVPGVVPKTKAVGGVVGGWRGAVCSQPAAGTGPWLCWRSCWDSTSSNSDLENVRGRSKAMDFPSFTYQMPQTKRLKARRERLKRLC